MTNILKNKLLNILKSFVTRVVVKTAIQNKSVLNAAKEAAIEEAKKAVAVADEEVRIADLLLEGAMKAGDTEAINTFRQRLIAADKAYGEAAAALKAVSK